MVEVPGYSICLFIFAIRKEGRVRRVRTIIQKVGLAYRKETGQKEGSKCVVDKGIHARCSKWLVMWIRIGDYLGKHKSGDEGCLEKEAAAGEDGAAAGESWGQKRQWWGMFACLCVCVCVCFGDEERCAWFWVWLGGLTVLCPVRLSELSTPASFLFRPQFFK